MSDEERDQPYRVGHGRPPPEHRFAKGTSGNPRGRPRKLRELEGEARRAQDLFLAEAKRLITVKEGGRAVQMPAFQAVVKSTLVAALKGSPTAQKAIIQMTLSIEAERERNRFCLSPSPRVEEPAGATEGLGRSIWRGRVADECPPVRHRDRSIGRGAIIHLAYARTAPGAPPSIRGGGRGGGHPATFTGHHRRGR